MSRRLLVTVLAVLAAISQYGDDAAASNQAGSKTIAPDRVVAAFERENIGLHRINAPLIEHTVALEGVTRQFEIDVFVVLRPSDMSQLWLDASAGTHVNKGRITRFANVIVACARKPSTLQEFEHPRPLTSFPHAVDLAVRHLRNET